MGQAVAVRTDYTAGEVRRLAKRAKDATQGDDVRAFPVRADLLYRQSCQSWGQ
jgi:hypothetical protein